MDSFDALIAKLEAIADDTRRDLTIAATQLRRWPSPRTLHWKPAAFLVPTTWGTLQLHAFAATEQDAATTAAVILKLHLRA
jgi:hypothetical protein